MSDPQAQTTEERIAMWVRSCRLAAERAGGAPMEHFLAAQRQMKLNGFYLPQAVVTGVKQQLEAPPSA